MILKKTYPAKMTMGDLSRIPQNPKTILEYRTKYRKCGMILNKTYPAKMRIHDLSRIPQNPKTILARRAKYTKYGMLLNENGQGYIKNGQGQ